MQGLENSEKSEDSGEKEELGEIVRDSYEHAIPADELAERIAIEKAHAHEDKYSAVRYNQVQ